MNTARYSYSVLVGCVQVLGLVQAYGSQEHRNADGLLGARHLGGAFE
jgi:hypothetical protein